MKIITSLTPGVVLMSISLLACKPDARQEADQDLKELKTWVDEHAVRAETATEEEWSEMKQEFDRRAHDLDAKSAAWDKEAQQEWEQLKMRWNETENKVEARLRNNDAADTTVAGDTIG